MGEKYKCAHKYNGDIRLVRGLTKDTSCEHLGEDLGVGEVIS